MPPLSSNELAQMYGSGHPLAAQARQDEGRRAQAAAGATGVLRAPAMDYDRAMLNRGRSVPMAGAYRALHPTGGIDSAPGAPGLYNHSAAAGQQYLRETTPGLSQQGPQFQRWANDPQRIAADQQAHGLWSPERLAQETARAQANLPAVRFANQPAPPSPMRPGGLLAGMQGQAPRIAPLGTPPAIQVPRTPDGPAQGQGLLAGHPAPASGGIGIMHPDLYYANRNPRTVRGPFYESSAEPRFGPENAAQEGLMDPTAGMSQHAVMANIHDPAVLRQLQFRQAQPPPMDRDSPEAGMAAVERQRQLMANYERSSNVGFGNRADRAAIAMRRAAGGRPIAPGAPAPQVAVPQPGSLEYANMMSDRHARMGNLASALASDNAWRMYESRQGELERQARIAGMGAETQGRNLTNQTILPESQARIAGMNAETQGRNLTNAGLPFQNMLAKAQAFMADQASKLGPFVRGALSGLPPDQLDAARRLASQDQAPASPPSPNPNFLDAQRYLFGPAGKMGADPSAIIPRDSADPIDAYRKALDMGFDLSDPNSVMSNHFQSFLRGHYGSEPYAAAGVEPQPGYFSSPSERDVARALWFRDGAPPRGAGAAPPGRVRPLLPPNFAPMY